MPASMRIGVAHKKPSSQSTLYHNNPCSLASLLTQTIHLVITETLNQVHLKLGSCWTPILHIVPSCSHLSHGISNTTVRYRL